MIARCGRTMAIQSPHDLLFKRAFDDPEVCRAQLERLLPQEVLELLDLDTLRVEPTRTIDGDLELREGDVLCRVDLRRDVVARYAGASEPGTVFVWFMFEHQSKSDDLMPLRDLEYMVRRWRALVTSTQPTPKKLPLIIPIVVAHAEPRWRAPRRLRDLFDAPEELLRALGPMLADCPLVLDDLMATTEEEIEARSRSSYLTLVLWSLRSRARVPDERLDAWTGHLARLRRERGQSPVLGILSYHVAVSPEEMPPLVRAAIKVSPELEETYVTLAERLEQKGFEQGMAKGVEQGRAKTLEQLVTLKFGAPSAETLARIAALDSAGLDRAVARILFASSIAELFDQG